MNYGKTKVRSQYDHRKQAWKIVKKTNNGAGGWCNFGISFNNKFISRERAEQAIDDLIFMYGGTYERG